LISLNTRNPKNSRFAEVRYTAGTPHFEQRGRWIHLERRFPITPFLDAGINTMKIHTSTQTAFDGVTGASALNVGDAVSVRAPMFMASGTPTIVASKIQKR
jgi:hypothetical protein